MFEAGRKQGRQERQERSGNEREFYRKLVLGVGALLLIIYVLGGEVRAADLFGTITVGGRPLQNADLVLKNGREVPGRTNQHGYYSIRNLPAGEYSLIIKLPDGASRPVKVRIFPQNTEKNVNLP